MPCLLTGCSPDTPSKDGGGTAPNCTTGPCCPEACKLVLITVIRNATQFNVTGAKNWAAVKKSSDDVIVEVTTDPNTEDCWKKIRWSGDPGIIGDKANQRRLSRAASKKYHVEAELCGVTDYVDVWIIWATVLIVTSGTTPPHSKPFGKIRDETEILGARDYVGIIPQGDAAAGKIVAVGTITPRGVTKVVAAGWLFKREVWAHDWVDGKKNKPGNNRGDRWNSTWVDDTEPGTSVLTPDDADKIYDIDAPNVAGYGVKSYETYNNFQQWVEWNGEQCSEKAPWYWRGRWRASAQPQVTLKDVGPGHKPLPDNPL